MSTFAGDTLKKLRDNKTIQSDDKILAVCAARTEHRIFQDLGFTNVTISNLDLRVTPEEFAPFDWSHQDACNLTFDDESYDFCFVKDGLHHCDSPHRALLEMYRVAKKGVIAVEARDSWAMRIAAYFNLVCTYEIEAVVRNKFACGGVNNSTIPNYVYRWTEREFQKTIDTHNPTGKHEFQYFHGLSLPFLFAGMSKNPIKKWSIHLLRPIIFALTLLFKKQMNHFAMVATKPVAPGDVWPWLELSDSEYQIDKSFAKARFHTSS